MFEVAIPDTALSNCTGLRDKTLKIGFMARAFAIFRVDRVLVYSTGRLGNNQNDRHMTLCLLRYMDTPQYLRKRVFGRSPMMQYVGMLPPLRTRSHPLSASINDIQVGDVRWGVQVRPGKIDLGLDMLVDYDKSVDQRKPTLFRVVSVKPNVKIEITDQSSLDFYFGFEVVAVADIVRYLNESRIRPRIAFSKKGVAFSSIEETLISLVRSSHSLIALFGGPHHGISDILVDDSTSLKNEIDLWVNSIPRQGTETVRLEEAILISLGLLNASLGDFVARSGYF
ncbi:MAG: putative RNA uridine N3 methyltransferase [Candidatus Thorarchaeota archaeon]